MEFVVVTLTVGYDRVQDLLAEADFLDVRDVGVGEEEALVSQNQLRLLRTLLTFHGFSLGLSVIRARVCSSVSQFAC